MQKSGWLILGVVLLTVLVLAVLLTACRGETRGGTGADAVLTFDSFDGGGPTYSVTIDDPSMLACTSERIYDKADHDQLTGASYTITYTFRGVRSGETTVRVSARSPIADNFDKTYSAVIDEDLTVTLTEIESKETGDDPIEPVPTLVMVIGDRTFYPAVTDTPAAEALIEKLSSQALELVLHDNGDAQKTGELPWMLPQSDESVTAKAGDILLQNGNLLCLSCVENTSEGTRLGTILDMTPDDFAELSDDSDVTVQLWVEWSE